MSYCYACDRFVAKPVIIEHRPYCGPCAEDHYASVLHDDEVTARIDAVIRADAHQVRDRIDAVSSSAPDSHLGNSYRIANTACTEAGNIPESGTLPPWVLDEEVDAYAAEPVPLAEQIAEFGTCAEYVMDALAANLADPWYRTEVIRVGVQRLVEGYEAFGDAMYKWDENRRDNEMFEEIADAVVYGTSGRFFDVRFT